MWHRTMSDPPHSDIGFKNKIARVWTTESSESFKIEPFSGLVNQLKISIKIELF